MQLLERLNNQIIQCTKCPRLVTHRIQIARIKRRQYREWDYWGRPLPGFGDAEARLYILGLAPAAHGGNRTGRMFTGDRSGDWLYEALWRYGFANQPDSAHRDDGLRLIDCYIGASVRCAPPGNKPLPEEFDACRPYLHQELRLLLRSEVIVTLGRTAFDQYLKCRRQSGIALSSPPPKFGHLALHHLPDGKVLIPSYHPSQQNTFTGKLTRAMFHRVFEMARAQLKTSRSPA